MRKRIMIALLLLSGMAGAQPKHQEKAAGLHSSGHAAGRANQGQHLSGHAGKPMVLRFADFKHYVSYFNTMEDENIKQAIPNDGAAAWMQENIPLFECPQQNFEELYYYRWWTLRKHIKHTEKGYVFTEFLIQRSYADKYNLISSALGHHIYESRWLHNPQYMNDNLHTWYRGNNGGPMKKLRFYSSWNIDAIYNRYLVNNDASFVKDLFPDLEKDYSAWEAERRLPSGLYWQYDVRDAMEETISGGRKEKNARPSINSYMYGNARALASIATMNGEPAKAELYNRKADTIKQLVQSKLWNAGQEFFEVLKEADTLSAVKEEIGFIPWYFHLPDPAYSVAWRSLTDTKTFCAPFGITTADRSHPAFRSHGCCKCEWDGAVWPFATAQTLTALANELNSGRAAGIADSNYFRLLQTYVESQYYRGRPYIGEYLDEKTGYWLKGDEERSRYYNHSTFNDLIITGLAGLRPAPGNEITVHPLLPAGTWDWFCLDNVLYHGKYLTIIWDKDGTRYKKGKGLSLWVNGKKVAASPELQPVVGKL
ncbi:glycosyl hydrolase family 65 protein [Chitinophaga sp. CB10]|uniref:MGH1-like glycoside hydrolase domain-containing protein n=1 Tax=Chitinophaga sp. CB10 TaxID=1891659 RepID=UPI0025C50A5C|nr:glycosyl hydrolase family 65 protein [Chitinophaga sp. CB10]